MQQREAIKSSIKNKEIHKEIKEWNNQLGGFVFVLFKYGDDIFKQHGEITPEDIVKLFYIATFVNYEGYLIYNDNYVNRADLREMLNITRNTFDKFFNKLIQLQILKTQNNNILINSNYFVRGGLDKKIQQTYNYTRAYINTVQYLYNNVSVRQHKRLGMYFKLIPYIHRQYNILCHNPEDIYNELKLITVKELKDILNYHRSSIKGFINELLSIQLNNGESILGTFRTQKTEGEEIIIINPRVTYGGNFDIEGGKDTILKWFQVNKK